jgi:hypothetical protein
MFFFDEGFKRFIADLTVRIILVLFVAVSIFCDSKAQLLVALKPGQSAFTYSTGLYLNQPVFSAGAAKSLHVHVGKLLNDNLTFFVDLSDRTNFMNLNKMQFTYGAQGYIIKYKSFRLLFRKTFTLNRYLSTGFKGTYLGGEIEIMPGIYKKKYYAALDFYYGDSFKGHIVDNPASQTTIKGQGREHGWVDPRLRTIKIGFNLGYYIGSHILVQGHIDYSVVRPAKLIHSPHVYGDVALAYIIDKRPAKTIQKSK